VEAKGTTAKIHGNLTIKNVTKPVVLDAEFLGAMKDNRGMQRLGFRATTRINRLDYGVTWNRLVEGGGSMLGDDVDIEITIAAVEQPPTPAPAP
jgi:polyisoprenoid-binding protein YceI